MGAEVTAHKSNHPYRVMVGNIIIEAYSLIVFVTFVFP